jgi:hypothetical protein
MSEVRGKCVLMFTWCKRFADKGKWDNLQTSSARQVCSHVHLVQAVCRQRKVRQFADLMCEASVFSCPLGASGLLTKESETICRPQVRGKCVLMFTWCKRFADKGKWDNLQTSVKLFISLTDINFLKESHYLWS